MNENLNGYQRMLVGSVNKRLYYQIILSKKERAAYEAIRKSYTSINEAYRSIADAERVIAELACESADLLEKRFKQIVKATFKLGIPLEKISAWCKCPEQELQSILQEPQIDIDYRKLIEKYEYL